ncbi:MAG: isocitrate lyase/phosphoenolpyruvate mutase family protein [Pyrinomonadaceae bacterium]
MTPRAFRSSSNARTDIFLKNLATYDATHVAAAIERAAACTEAGADGFFAPGLRKPDLIRQLADASPIPAEHSRDGRHARKGNGELAACSVFRVSLPGRGRTSG